MTLVSLSRRAPTQLPEGPYDVRGWEVRTELDDEKVGKVEDMLVDEEDRPRYLDIGLGTFRKNILVPLAVAHADPSTEVIWIEDLDHERIREIPDFDQDLSRISPEYEQRLLREYRMLSRDGGHGEEHEEEMPRLARLGDLGDYRVAKGVTDPRGWKVIGGDGQVLGEVKELIVDPAAMTTRYLDCEVDEAKLGLEPLSRHILVPADRVRLDRSSKRVVVDGVFARDVHEYPMYQGLPLDPSAERAIEEVFSRPRAEQPGEGRVPEERASRETRERDAEVRRFFGVRARPTGDTTSAPVRSRGRPGEPEGEGRRDVERVASEMRASEMRESEMRESERRAAEAGAPESRASEATASDERDSETISRDENVRIRISGDDIIIERHPRGRGEDG